MKKYTTSQRLKEIMTLRGIKQIDILNKIQPICEKWGIKMGSNDLSQYVTGKVEPSQKKLSVLAEVLDTNEVWLMGYDVPINKDLSANDFSINEYSSEYISEGINEQYNNLNLLSLKTNIPNTEIKKIITGEDKLPKPKYLKKIADALEQDVTDYFNGYGYIDNSEENTELYDSGIRFLLNQEDRNDLCTILEELWKKEDKNITAKTIYSNLFSSEKDEFSSIDLKSILDSNSKINFDNAELIEDENVAYIPVLGVIKAGIPIEAQEDILEYVDIPKSWLQGGKTFYGLKISGDSMYPKYLENDIVIFEKNEDMYQADNKDCAILINGFDATFKKLKLNQNGITLIPYNLDNTDGFETTYYDSEQIQKLPIKIIGIAKEKRTRL